MAAMLTQSAAFAATPLATRRHVAARKVICAAPRAQVSLPELPWPINALEPKMSKETLEYHYGKHHAAYVNNLNGQIKGTAMDKMSVVEIMLKSWNGGKPGPEFNNAAQVVNHTFFWEGMAPNAGGAPTGKLAEAIARDFGSFDAFKTAFATAGATQFGSGWAWLSTDKSGKLEVTKTPNAENPWVHGKTPVLTMDVWEHAYYIDHRNARPAFIAGFWDLVSWPAVAARYEAALK